MSAESQTPPPNATAVAGRFELVAELGRGSSGTVHRAALLAPYRGLAVGTEVAIKFLRTDLLRDQRAVERFRAEGEFGQRLQSEHLAAIYGMETVATDSAEVTFLVMEFVAGKTLRQFLESGDRLVEDLVRRLGADAAAGLSALHRHKLVHRDVKPENLILTPERQLKIVDLGLVRQVGEPGGGSASRTSSGASGGLVGSVAYAAPESLQGGRGGPRSDLYSLGVVLYELCTGRHPFAEHASTDEMIDAHINVTPAPPSHLRPYLSPFLNRILLDLLQKEPDLRPRDAGDLHHILEQGEQSEWWQRLERDEPATGSRRRLRRMRRVADAPFFGRATEVAALDSRLEAAFRGAGSTVLVTGPQGSGRRRLCDHTMERWLQRERPPLLLGGEADPDLGHAEPFASALLDLLLRGDAADSPQAEARATAAAEARFGYSPEAAQALARVALGRSEEAPEVRADRLAGALLALAAPGRPLVFRVDLASQLDTSGRLVANRLRQAAPQRHLLVVLTGDLEDELRALPRLELSGLDESEFVSFARALFRAGTADEAFLFSAHQILSGVPGNLIEALEHLASEGRMQGRTGDYHGLPPDLELQPAPDHLARIRQHVGRLSPDERLVLAAAAVLGRRCALADLVALLDRTELAVLEPLSLFGGRIVRAQGGEVWFRHPAFLRVLLDSIAPDTRHDLHLRAAELIAQRNGSRLLVGMHRSQALDHEGCIEPLLDGLEELVRSGSRRTALRIAARLGVHLDRLAHGPERDRRLLRFHLLHAEARANAGHRGAVSRCYRQAEAMARELGDLVASAIARTGLASRELENGHLLAAISILEGIHDELAPLHDPRADEAAARAHGLQGRILLYRGQAVDGHRHLQAALRRLSADRDELRAHLLIDRARLEALQHHYPTARKTLRRVEKLHAARHLPHVVLRLHLYRGQVRAALGDEKAVQDLRFALDEAERLSLPDYADRAALFLGERQLWRRRDDEARTLFERAKTFARVGGDRMGETVARAYLFGLGDDDAELAQAIEELALPSATATWLLARAARGMITAAEREILDSLVRETNLPLDLHLRSLRLAERMASARSLVRTIAQRMPDRRARRRFLLQWPAGARI